jgi:hypothetical protein
MDRRYGWGAATGAALMALAACTADPAAIPAVELPAELERTYTEVAAEFRPEIAAACSPGEVAVVERIWRYTVYLMSVMDRLETMRPAEVDAVRAQAEAVEREARRLSPRCRTAYERTL